MSNPVLTRLLEQRTEQETFIDQLLARVAEEGRDLVEAERKNLEAARQRIKEIDEQVVPLEEYEKTRAAHRAATPEPAPARPDSGGAQRLTAQPREQKYRSAGHYLVDYMRALGDRSRNVEPDRDAMQRVSAALGRAVGDVPPGVHQTTADTPGLLPELIVGEVLDQIDGMRPFIQSIGAKDLSGIPGKIFHRPHVTQHTQAGEQTAEKAELPSRELKIMGIPFTKRTFGGWLNVSRQEIDWTSPTAWDIIIADLQNSYSEETDEIAAEAFATGVTQVEQIALADKDDVSAYIRALYKAAVKAATANGTQHARPSRLPNTIWTSIDMWADLGALLSIHRVMNSNSAGGASPTAFAGDIIDIPRVMVPGLPAGTMVVGRAEKFEFYEERIGLLSAIEPKYFGVEVAYGGYAAFGFLDQTAFAKIDVLDA